MLDVTIRQTRRCQRAALLPLLVAEGEAPAGLWAEVDGATGGAIGRALEAAEFKGEKGKTCMILAPGAGLTRVVAVGLGKSAGPDDADRGGGGRRHRRRRCRARRRWRSPPAALDAALCRRGRALGAVLRTYRFDRYRTKEKPEEKPKLATLTVFCDDPTRGAQRVGAAEGRCRGRVPAPATSSANRRTC